MFILTRSQGCFVSTRNNQQPQPSLHVSGQISGAVQIAHPKINCVTTGLFAVSVIS